jgi:hypothetical protein
MGGGLVVTTNTCIERKIMSDKGFANFGKIIIEMTLIFVKSNHD